MELRFFEIYRNAEYLTLLAQGAGVSAILTISGGLFGLFLAIGLAISRAREVPVIAPMAASYVEVVRNTPLIVQLFFVAFGLPLLLSYSWPFWAHALLALTLNFSAYFSEILRSAINTVPIQQNEAATALGLRQSIIFRKIIFPQAVAASFPSLNSQFIFLFLTTGVISEIGVTDLTNAGLFIDSRTFRSFEVFITLTVIYIGIALTFKAALTAFYNRVFRWKVAS
ncbi:MAG: amino acid ABC transporter permease [Pseudomonadota bacterium]